MRGLRQVANGKDHLLGVAGSALPASAGIGATQIVCLWWFADCAGIEQPDVSFPHRRTHAFGQNRSVDTPVGIDDNLA